MEVNNPVFHSIRFHTFKSITKVVTMIDDAD